MAHWACDLRFRVPAMPRRASRAAAFRAACDRAVIALRRGLSTTTRSAYAAKWRLGKLLGLQVILGVTVLSAAAGSSRANMSVTVCSCSGAASPVRVLPPPRFTGLLVTVHGMIPT
jgi:hypothetical protein